MTKQKDKTILAIDDEKNVLESLKLVFEDDYNVITTTSAKEGIEIVKKQKIDVVFLDIRMPEMWGVEVLKKIKEVDENIKVLMVTAINSVETGIEALSLGAHDYIIKPFDINKLMAKVKELVG